MSLFDYLASPAGIELTHAFIILITAVAAYVSYLARRSSVRNRELLNGHLQEHEADRRGEISDPPVPLAGEGSQ